MAKTGYYDFSGGLNYRDDYIAPTELRDANNLYWDGGQLSLRKGYEQRNVDLTAPSADFTIATILKQARIESLGEDAHFLFVGCSTDGSTVIDRLAIYYTSGNAHTTSQSYVTLLTTVGTPEWTTADPLSIAVMGDRLYLAKGDENPFVIYRSGTTWRADEMFLTYYLNSTATTGAGIIDNTTDGEWSGVQYVVAGEAEGQGYLMVGDDHAAYFGIDTPGIRVSEDASGTTAERIAGINESWDVGQYIVLNPNARIWKAISIGKHFFFMGYNGVYRLYLRDFYGGDYDFVRISDNGCWGGALAHDAGLFYVGKDGIYANDSIMSYNISKKMWSEVKNNHSAITDYEDSSIAVHNGYLYISFPNASEADVWTFDPDYIYTVGDESYAPMFRFKYTDTGGNAMGFEDLAVVDKALYGVSSGHVWELDHDTLDQHSTGSGRPIQWHMRSGWDDQGIPNTEKAYTKLGIETSSAIADGTTDGNYDFQVAFSVNHSTAGNARGISTGIDMEAATGTLHVNKSLDVPISSGGYVLDGNCGAVEIIGETSNVTTGAGDISMSIYGYTVEYQPLISPHEEVAT